jgi:hypothetical protein
VLGTLNCIEDLGDYRVASPSSLLEIARFQRALDRRGPTKPTLDILWNWNTDVPPLAGPAFPDSSL